MNTTVLVGLCWLGCWTGLLVCCLTGLKLLRLLVGVCRPAWPERHQQYRGPARLRRVWVSRRLLACGSVEVVEVYPDTINPQTGQAETICRAHRATFAHYLVTQWLPARFDVSDSGWLMAELESLPLENSRV